MVPPELAPRTTNITAEHKDAFDALRDGGFTNFALFSCFLNGEPTAAIVAITEQDGEYVVTPMFVAVTPQMTITDHDGIEPQE
jgi:hypothetical protein